MPEPLARDVYIDELLTQMSVAYMQDVSEFLAFRVFPVLPVDLETSKYAIYPKGYWLRNEMAPRGLGQPPRQAGYKVQYGSYAVDEYALEKVVDDRTRRNSRDPMGPDRGATNFLTTQAMLNWGINWANKFFKTGIWTQERQGVASAPSGSQFLQFDQAGSNPPKTIRDAKTAVKLATGFEPNVLILGQDVYNALAENTVILDRIKYTQTGLVTASILASLFEVEEVFVADAVNNIAAEGQADNMTWIADSKAALLLYRTTTPNIEIPSAGYTFAWESLVPGQTNDYGGVIERGRDERAKSDWFQIRQAVDQRVVAADLAVFLRSVVV